MIKELTFTILKEGYKARACKYDIIIFIICLAKFTSLKANYKNIIKLVIGHISPTAFYFYERSASFGTYDIAKMIYGKINQNKDMTSNSVVNLKILNQFTTTTKVNKNSDLPYFIHSINLTSSFLNKNWKKIFDKWDINLFATKVTNNLLYLT